MHRRTGDVVVAEQPTHRREMGQYFVLAQTGLELVAPVGVGVLLDNYFGWSPWATATGAIVGLVGGLTHMIIVLRRIESRRAADSPRDAT
jgi:F0F1-type ATP synthase assembly protein I